MKNSSIKRNFTTSHVVRTREHRALRCGRSAGFTLVEILVASAIIVAIFSMICGSYFATSKSTQVCKAKIALSRRARGILEQMTRQIRCSYAPSPDKLPYSPSSISQQAKLLPANAVNYFLGNPDDSTGEILKFVTTNGIFGGKDKPECLHEVTYKFQKSTRILLSTREKFVHLPANNAEKNDWRPVATDIESIELAFFDGKKWSNKWDFNKVGKLPCAVKITLCCEDESYRQYQYGTIAYVCCRMNQQKETQTRTLVSANR